MKINYKIDPYQFPIIIIVAFVIGFILAIALGFTPQHGSRNREHRGFDRPAVVQTISGWDWSDL